MGEIKSNNEIREVSDIERKEVVISESEMDKIIQDMLDECKAENEQESKLEANTEYYHDGVCCSTDDNGEIYKEDGKCIPRMEYTLNGDTFKVDDNGDVYKENGKFILNIKYTINGITIRVDENGDRYPESAEGYGRPNLRTEVKKEIYDKAPHDKQGRYLDANTGKPIEGTPDIGHKPGHEHWREQQRAREQKMSISEFNNRMNNADFYQLEDPSNNRSRRFEDKSEW